MDLLWPQPCPILPASLPGYPCLPSLGYVPAGETQPPAVRKLKNVPVRDKVTLTHFCD